MMTWAVVSGCTAIVKDHTGFLLARLFLGVEEAPVRIRSRGIGLISIISTETSVSALYEVPSLQPHET